MQRRRTIRDFSDRPVPRQVIEYCIRTARDGAKWRESAAVAFCCGRRSCRQTQDSHRGRGRRRRVLRTPRTKTVAGGARSSRYRLAQAVPGNRAVADRGICATVSNFSGWNTLTDILLDWVGWHCHRYTRDGRALVWFDVANAHAQSNGIPQPNSQTSVAGETVFATRSRSSGSGR